jgi:uncharacterized membrane protein
MDKIYVFFLAMIVMFGCTSSDNATASASGDDTVIIPLSQISQTVKHYQYDANGVTVKYFAVKGSDGLVRTAFDACEVCYRAKKGYSQSGSDVVCNNCGLKFKIDGLGTKNKGKGCWPGYLPHIVEGDYVVIKKSDLKAGSYMFS